MEIKELRIGNYIRHNVKEDGTDQFIEPNEDAISEDDMWNLVGHGLDGAEPIPLSDDWLVKLGFLSIDDDGLYHHPDNECFQVQSPTFDEPWKHIWDTTYTEAPIQYVHSLQNLYYALTGQELEIKK